MNNNCVEDAIQRGRQLAKEKGKVLTAVWTAVVEGNRQIGYEFQDSGVSL